ncbi:TPA: hypothetical protein ACFNMI_001428 [Neisseria bacilliformis]|uniref:hypothetical protein n=1 Tax=Neisseria bacilliformis TaxID=267212 RepID=UPI0002EBF28F|nr:hypothetical protein [Neisseria bacilliformis]QMT48109.1 hypothetical protein H3L91_03020 [Neisseria bacilliformis]
MAAANRRAEIAPFFRRPHRSSEKTANPFTKPDTMPKRPAVLLALLLAACGAAPADNEPGASEIRDQEAATPLKDPDKDYTAPADAPDETASAASDAEDTASEQTASQ